MPFGDRRKASGRLPNCKRVSKKDLSLNVENQQPGRVCSTCGVDYNHLSDVGFSNHQEFCRIVIGVPARHQSTELMTTLAQPESWQQDPELVLGVCRRWVAATETLEARDTRCLELIHYILQQIKGQLGPGQWVNGGGISRFQFGDPIESCCSSCGRQHQGSCFETRTTWCFRSCCNPPLIFDLGPSLVDWK
jgi:hypothetical protein